MDTWTSPNNRAFVTWTIHLEHKGQILAFLVDIIEVPEVHTVALSLSTINANVLLSLILASH
jgi:hypothetical protein